MAIIKIIGADEDGPDWFEDRWKEHKDWGNNDWSLALSDNGEIWFLNEWDEYDEELDDDVAGWKAERYVNPICENKKNIWHMQLGCRSTFEYTKLYPTKEELVKVLKGAFNWQALMYGIEPCEPRPIDFGGKMFYPPDYN